MTFLAILVGRLVACLSRLTGRGGGTSLPGAVALRLCPDLHARLARTLPMGVVLITGTNGKTTTSKMAASILRASGLRVVRNVAGANLRQGLASTLLGAATWSGRIPADVAVLEVDEGAAPREIRDLAPRLLLITNLFRDQLDRYGELATTARRLADAVADGLPQDAALCYNADDPLVAWTAERFNGVKAPFGLDCPNRAVAEADHASDSADCEWCGAGLAYAPRYGAHIGRWRCPACGRERPEPSVRVTEAELTEDLRERVGLSLEDGTRIEAGLKLPGLYNVANAAAATAVCAALGVDAGTIARGLEETSPAFGRLETVEFPEGKTAHLMLVKNPAGLNEVTRLIAAAGRACPTMIALNDNTADGHDVSWIWDADFERVVGLASPIVASGVRAHDMALRLKYAGVEPSSITVLEDTRAALDLAVASAPPGGHVYVLPTYTAMLDLRGRLESEGRVAPFWEEI